MHIIRWDLIRESRLYRQNSQPKTLRDVLNLGIILLEKHRPL